MLSLHHTPTAAAGRRVGRALAGLALGLIAGLAFTATPASAHADLLQASPGPGQQAGGTLDFVDLVFTAPMANALVEVTHDGVAVPGAMEETDGLIARFAFTEPLSSPGRYDVTYTITSIDKDRYSSTYFFTYEPASPPAVPVGREETGAASPDEGGGWNRTRIIASLVVVGGLCGLAFVYLTRLERRRRTVTPPADPYRTRPSAPDDQPLDR